MTYAHVRDYSPPPYKRCGVCGCLRPPYALGGNHNQFGPWCRDVEWCGRAKERRAEVLAEFAALQAKPHWETVEDVEHTDRIRKRESMHAQRHGDKEPQKQPPCQGCGASIPPPGGRKKVRMKARKFCTSKCAARTAMRRKKR